MSVRFATGEANLGKLSAPTDGTRLPRNMTTKSRLDQTLDERPEAVRLGSESPSIAALLSIRNQIA